MIASVLIEYSVKSLDKTFDYIVKEELLSDIKIGQKVLVPFGNTIVEGFVMSLSNKFDENIEYKEVYEIVEKVFCLNEELLSLGKEISEKTLCTKISAYQAMFPKALKAKSKVNMGIVTETYCFLNKNIDIDEYVNTHSRNKKEIEIINFLLTNKEAKRKDIYSSSLRKLIQNNIVLIKEVEVKKSVDYIKEEKKNIILTREQMRAYNEIKTSTNNKILLHGVTGSGKTEIYIKLIEDTLVLGKSVIMLVPEISLTPQIVNRFKSDFGDDVAVLHSGLSEREKFDEYRRIVNKEVSIVVGARSAVFAPLSNIGLIIIDECSSPSFKQDVNPKYNSIDVAFMRSETYKCKVVMGSATPLLEQYARGQKGVFKLVSLTSRVSDNLPNYLLVDMNKEVKKRNFIISSVLKEKINDTIKSDKQVILLLNRRGYSTFLSCSSCGFVWKCPNCDISLIYHKSTNNLRCHYCGYTTKMTNICPKCKEDAIKDLGMGTEKLESIINKMFPLGRTVRMDLDTTRNKGSHSKIIENFKNHKYNILIGTQMISKGLNFKDVTLVGVINADASLNIPDFRSSERTFELLTQTGGRTGRYDLPGDVVIQTYNKDNYCLECVKKGDYIDFYTKEMKIRKDLKYPPYYYLTTVKIISDKYELARDEANNVKKYLTRNLNEGIIVLGPSTASVFKLMNKYYFQIILKYKNEANMLEVLKNINEMYVTNKVGVDININPLNLL